MIWLLFFMIAAAALLGVAWKYGITNGRNADETLHYIVRPLNDRRNMRQFD